MKEKSKGKVILYLMRHGETIINRAHRTQGWCDGILTRKGIEAAINVGRGLSCIDFKSIYSSDLGRAIKTANIVIKENKFNNKLKLKEIEGLREVYFGKYEGEYESVMLNDMLSYLNVKSIEEAAEKYEFQKAYCDSVAALDETNEAEDYNTALSRVMKSLNDICIENEEDNDVNVLLVVHGGMLRLIIDKIDKSYDLRNISNTSISKVVYDNGNYSVISVNDLSYSKNNENLIK